jgi:hypothetical protein
VKTSLGPVPPPSPIVPVTYPVIAGHRYTRHSSSSSNVYLPFMGSLLFSYYIYIFMFYVRYIHVMLYGISNLCGTEHEATTP